MMATVETVCASLGQFMARSSQEDQLARTQPPQGVILNSVADGIFGTDRDGEVIFVNPAAEVMLGAAEGSLMGRQVRDVVHMGRKGPASNNSDGDASPLCAPFPLPRERVVRMCSSAATALPSRWSFPLTPMQEGGSVVGSVLSFRDISQRYALDRMKDEFISTVSHELRTPLTSIRGALGLLSAGLVGEVSEKAANLLRIAVSNSDRLVRLINDILDLERMQSGRAPLSVPRTRLSEIAQQALEALAPVADSAHIRLVLEAGTASVEADPDRLLQVLTNLLSNAIKFSPPDAEVRQLWSRPGSTGQPQRSSIRGAAFPQTSWSRSLIASSRWMPPIPARRAAPDWDWRSAGPSSISTAVASGPSAIPTSGTTFSFFVPFRQSLETDSTPFPDREVRDGTILISDSDAQARRTVGDHLTQHGYKVVEAEDAEQTLVQARRLPLEAILLDISLSSGNGWQTLQMLKNDPLTAAIPIVVLSVWPSTDHSDIPEHIDGWVQKPLDEVALLGELARVLHGGNEPARVLIVEDDEDLAKIILTTFQSAGIEVLHAATRRRAIEICETFPPDLLILDLSLPDGDGFNVVDWLRQQKDLCKTPLVVYSARDVLDFERRQLQLGPTEFLTKASVQPQEVEALVLTMLRRLRKAENENQSSDDGAISRPA